MLRTAEEVAYAAGFFDGEGSVALYRGGGPRRNTWVFTVRIPQSDECPLQWLVDIFGGTYRPKNAGKKYGWTKKDHWEWSLNGSFAAVFLRLVQPYLLVKAEKVEEVLAQWDRRLEKVV